MTTSNQITKHFQEIEANFNVYHQFIEDGNEGAAKYTQFKVESLCKELQTLIKQLSKEHEASNDMIQIKNMQLSNEMQTLTAAKELVENDQFEKNKQIELLTNEVETLSTKLAQIQTELTKATSEATSDRKELKALREKNPGLMEATIVDLNQQLERAKKRISELEIERKDNRKTLKAKTADLSNLKEKTVGYVPLSKWIPGKQGLQRYRIIETDAISRIESLDDGSMYSGFIETNFQLQVEITSGVLYKVHVSDWLCPVNPQDINHSGDYPVELDKLLKMEFEKRISKTNPTMIKAVKNARSTLIEELESLTDEEKAILKTAHIKSLYECVIFPPNLFLNFVRKHNTAVEIDEAMGKDLYDKLHYEGCAIKADLLLDSSDKINCAIAANTAN